ncbi:hypothetical protein, partial [Brevibacillus borstelensis]|uniref:hypothetical protein n=1 Tax=Brevibacillus borstelensis TaxID=45462 RepID=UPI0030C45D08
KEIARLVICSRTKYFSSHNRHHFDTEVPQFDNWHYFGKNASLFSFQRAFRAHYRKVRILI